MMNKLLVALLITFCIQKVGAQEIGRKTKTIEITGEAHQEITPDEIYFRISLKEYKKGGKKINIHKLETELKTAVINIGLPSENLTVENIFGFSKNWKKRKSEDFLTTKHFQLKLNEVNKINDLVNYLDEDGIQSININYYTHSKLEDLKQELKVQAIKSAQKKAKRLLGAIGEELSGVIEVSESGNGYRPQIGNIKLERELDIFSFRQARVLDVESKIDFKKIKLEANIHVVFAIK